MNTLRSVPTVGMICFIVDAELYRVLKRIGYRISEELVLSLTVLGGALLLTAAIVFLVRRSALDAPTRRCGVLLPVAAACYCWRVYGRLPISLALFFETPVVVGPAAFGVFALLVASFLIFCKCVRPIRAVAMHVAKLLALVPTVVFLLWLPLFFMFSLSACRTRWIETPSPDDAHIADITLEDYGAVGGSAYVCIRKRTIGEGIFRLEGIGTTVYSCSNWSTAAKLQLQWTDNSHLQVLVGDEVVRQASVR